MPSFSPIPLDKWAWHPSPLVYQVVLVASLDDDRHLDVAPKSNCTIAAFRPLTFGFGCQKSHQTYRNIAATREFTVNILSVELADAIWAMPDIPAADRLAAAGLTASPGQTAATPTIDQCSAHLECTLERVIDFDSGEVFILGRVNLIEVDSRCLLPDATPDRYLALGTPLLFLEPGWYAPLGTPTPVRSTPVSSR